MIVEMSSYIYKNKPQMHRSQIPEVLRTVICTADWSKFVVVSCQVAQNRVLYMDVGQIQCFSFSASCCRELAEFVEWD